MKGLPSGAPANCRPWRSARARVAATLLSTALPWLVAGCAGEPSRYVPPPDLAGRVDALFADYAAPGSPGVAVLVAHDGEVRHRRGYGLANLGSGEPITPRTAFRLASVSKQFVAMAVMMLAESGDLAYDDPVSRYLPELDRFGNALTVRHLLQHTGGLPDYYEELERRGAEGPMPTHEDGVRLMSSWGEPLFAPGERYEYSNPGYEMLAAIVERVSGEPLRVFLARRVFTPLGMTGTVVRDASEPEIGHRAIGYSRIDGELEEDDEHRLNHVLGAGGIYSTIDDLYRWDQALYGERLVTSKTLGEAFAPARLAGGETFPYGFGWRLVSLGALGRGQRHSGGWVGFSTHIARYPQRRFTVVLLSNLSDFAADDMADRIVDLYFPARVIAGARVVDGTGAPARRADVRFEGDRITAVGKVQPAAGDLVVDAGGWVLAPGFIDAHSHADAAILDRRSALGAVSQGITTAVAGQDGGSRLPLAELFSALEQAPAAVNLASFAGHGTLREAVLGDDFRRPATAAEIAAMAELLERELAAGALGLSTGLEYDPGIYATTGEVVALARVAAAAGGRYISHVRSEDRRFWPAIEEVLAIGREAALPVQISHLKLAMTSLHGRGDELIARLEAARAEGVEVTADLYPYTYWQSTLRVMFPDRDYRDRAAALFAVTELARPEEMLIPTFAPAPELEGRTLAEIATRRDSDPAATLIALVGEAEAWRRGLDPAVAETTEVESVIATSMREEDVERLMRWPHTSFCTDGELAGSHPRGFGAFPRVLGRYVRERRVLGLEEAVHKMTAATAERLGIAERGTIAPGRYADLVLFDPATIADRATIADPRALSTGIERVWVNGRVVYEYGQVSGRYPGRVLRRRAGAR